MRRVSQSDLGREISGLLNAVAAGETVIVTKNGVDVAELRPLPHHEVVSSERLYPALGAHPAGDPLGERAEADTLLGGEDWVGNDEDKPWMRHAGTVTSNDSGSSQRIDEVVYGDHESPSKSD